MVSSSVGLRQNIFPLQKGGPAFLCKLRQAGSVYESPFTVEWHPDPGAHHAGGERFHEYGTHPTIHHSFGRCSSETMRCSRRAFRTVTMEDGNYHADRIACSCPSHL